MLVQCTQAQHHRHALQTRTGQAWVQELTEHEVPHLQRCNLTQAVLQLKSVGIDSIMSYPFLDPPPAEAAVRALERLYALGAVNDDAKCAITVFATLCLSMSLLLWLMLALFVYCSSAGTSIRRCMASKMQGTCLHSPSCLE